jgi:peptidoglycan-associated lipoprotein
LQEEKAYLIRVKADGYYTDSIEINTVGYAVSHTFDEAFFLKSKEPETVEITINEPIRLNNIYYDFDDDKILKEAESDLELLFGLMNEYPDMIIELSSHTDARGNDNYNLDLSQRRANSAKEWLVQRGINERRVQAVGYGENQILNQCKNGVDCTEDEHRLNRRTEFKIIAGPTSIQIKKEVLRDKAKEEGNGSGAIPPPDDKFESYASVSQVVQPLKEKKAMIKWVETFHDFGVVPEGSKPKCEFEFINKGNVALKIEWVNSDRFTQIDWPKEIIEPGKKAKLKVTYDSSDKEGEYEVVINVIANTEPPVTQARFRAFVERTK